MPIVTARSISASGLRCACKKTESACCVQLDVGGLSHKLPLAASGFFWRSFTSKCARCSCVMSTSHSYLSHRRQPTSSRWFATVHTQPRLNNSDGRHGTRPASGPCRTRAPDTAASKRRNAIRGLRSVIARPGAPNANASMWKGVCAAARLQARANQLCLHLPAPSIAPALRPVVKAPVVAAGIAQAARCLRVPLRRRW